MPATLPPRPRLVERYREFLPVTDATPVVSLGEGATPLVPARRLGAVDRRPEPAPQDRGPEPHRLVQGPGHGHGRREGARGRGEERHLRLDRQHVGLGRRVRRRRGPRVRRRAAGWQDRPRQAAPGAGLRRPGRQRDGQLRRGAARGARPVRAGRAPDHARQLRQPVPARGPEDGRVRGLRRPGPRAGHPRDPGRQRRQHQRVLAGLPRVPRRRPRRTPCRACGASRPPAPRRWSPATRSRPRRPSRPRSASATRPPGTSRSRPGTSPAAGSRPSPTTRSCTPTAS